MGKPSKAYAAKQRRSERRRKTNPHTTANPAAHRADMERRRSNAASPHDGKSRHDRTKGAAKRAAIRESGGY